MAASVEAQAIPSLSSYVRGKDIESGRWVYVLSARAVLEDSFASLTLKRRLESGRVSPDEVPEGVIAGRVALADEATVEDAVQAAAEATKIWRAAPCRSASTAGWSCCAPPSRSTRTNSSACSPWRGTHWSWPSGRSPGCAS
ncbi:hypothetical protein LT493_06430 [Streptomyces tricolor]|nr:hypothetical protein [Streptomyces tricolor]